MPLTPSSVKRSLDATGDEIKTFTDADSKRVQAVALVDADGNHITLSQLADMLAALQVLDNIVSGSKALVTEDNSASILSALSDFGTNNVEEASATITYVGKEKADGTWLVMQIDTSSGTAITYATVTNNAAVTTYADAWSGRATLTYGTYGSAF